MVCSHLTMLLFWLQGKGLRALQNIHTKGRERACISPWTSLSKGGEGWVAWFHGSSIQGGEDRGCISSWTNLSKEGWGVVLAHEPMYLSGGEGCISKWINFFGGGGEGLHWIIEQSIQRGEGSYLPMDQFIRGGREGCISSGSYLWGVLQLLSIVGVYGLGISLLGHPPR